MARRQNSLLQLHQGLLGMVPEAGITATAGGGQAAARQLLRGNNLVTVVGSAGDSVKLPACDPGGLCIVTNASANSMNVFGQTGDSIYTGAANAAYALPANTSAIFVKSVANLAALTATWYVIKSS